MGKRRMKYWARQLLAPALLVLASLPARADLQGSSESSALVRQAAVLSAKGQFQEAIDALERARKLSPQASEPVSALANLVRDLSVRVKPGNDEYVKKLRGQAAGLAQQALTLAPGDPLAKEVLRMLEDPESENRYRPSPEAMAKMNDGEAAFHAGQYGKARGLYREAQRLDPGFSMAWVMEGDCYYMEKDWEAAEKLFLKATQVDPNNGQAWRFLADARLRREDVLGFFSAAVGAVAAAPNQKPSWDRLAYAGNARGKALEALNYVRKAGAVRGEDGKFTVTMAEEFKDTTAEQSTDHAIWLLYALGQLQTLMIEDAGKKMSPYATELASWDKALEHGAERAAAGKPPESPVLRQLLKFRQEQQLEPAILLLMYREAYRPDFEAWKREHPGGVHAFITSYQLMP